MSSTRLLFLMLLLPAISAAQVTDCTHCRDGYVPCRNRTCKRTRCLDIGDHICTKAARLDCCRGLRRIPCESCGDAAAHAEFEGEMAERSAWLEEMAEIDAKLGIRDLQHIQTDHFRLHFSLEKVKVKSRVYRTHDAMHLYARRLEELLADWKSLLGDVAAYPRTGHWEIYILRDRRQQDRVTHTIIGGGATKQFGTNTSTFVVGADKTRFNGDEALHAHVYHHVSHLITEQGFPVGSVKYPGWLTVGVARWLEIKKFGATRNSCTGEVAAGRDRWLDGKWRGKVYTLVRRAKEPRFSSWCDRGTKDLVPMLHGLAWSKVDFLLTRHPKVAGDVARSITRGLKTSSAIRENLGWSLAKFHDEWRAYVEEAYGR